RILAGFGLTALGLAGVCVLVFGWKGCLDYARLLLGFAQATGGGLAVRTWKYVDLNSFSRLLLGDPVAARWVLLAVAGPPILLLAVAWWRLDRAGERYQLLVWGSTLAWTPVANVYVGVYDSVLAVGAALLGAG